MTKHKPQKARPRQTATVSLESIIRNARTYPLVECRISSDWQASESGFVQILVTRQQPDGRYCFGLFLIDHYCLGVKDAMSKVNTTPEKYHSEVIPDLSERFDPIVCKPDLAHQWIYAAIDYAGKLGFEPHRDYLLAQNVLMPRGELPEPYKLTFGKDGKPFYINGPYDNADQIIAQLEKSVGKGNYNVLRLG